MVSSAAVLPLCISLSPITVCVNGNWCQARQPGGREGGRNGSVGSVHMSIHTNYSIGSGL